MQLRSHLASRPRLAPSSARRASHIARAAPPFFTVTFNGKTIPGEGKVLIGSHDRAQVRITEPGVEPVHASLEGKNGRVFLTARPDSPTLSLFSPSGVFLDGTEVRPGVAYMVSPGATVRVATGEVHVSFEERGTASPLMMGLMKGMAQDKEVRERLEG